MRALILSGILVFASCSLIVWLNNAKLCEQTNPICEGEVLVKCTEGFEDRISCASKDSCFTDGEGRCGACGDGLSDDGEICLEALPQKITLNLPPKDFVITDANNNGDPDVIAFNSNGATSTAQIFLGVGDGTFGGSQSNFLGVNDTGMAVTADLDHSAGLDLIFSNSGENIVRNALNGGAQFYASEQQDAVGPNPRGLVLADINGDALLDIITANDLSSSFSLLLQTNNPADRFTVQQNANFSDPTQGRFLVDASDFDDDGDLDLVFAAQLILQFVEQTQPLVFDLATQPSVGPISALHVLDGEVYVSHADQITKLSNRANGGFTFDESLFLQESGDITTFFFDDLDGDNVKDLIVLLASDNLVKIYRNEGGAFIEALSVPVPNSPFNAKTSDVNSDGQIDLLVECQLSSQIVVLLSNK